MAKICVLLVLIFYNYRSPIHFIQWPQFEKDIIGIFVLCEPDLFLKMGQPRPLLSFIFRSFQINIITIIATNICEKISFEYMVPGIKPTTFGHESPPITTRPGLPDLYLRLPLLYNLYLYQV